VSSENLCFGVPGSDSHTNGTARAILKEGLAMELSFERSLQKNLSSCLILRTLLWGTSVFALTIFV